MSCQCRVCENDLHPDSDFCMYCLNRILDIRDATETDFDEAVKTFMGELLEKALEEST